MSCVQNVILAFSILEDRRAMVGEVNRILAALGQVGAFNLEQDYGGSKALERPTYLGAFNYLEVSAFVERPRALPWKEPSEVQVYVCDQHEDIYAERFWAAP